LLLIIPRAIELPVNIKLHVYDTINQITRL